MTTDQLKQQNDLTAAECDALLKLILSTPNRLTDKYADDFDVNFRKIRHKLGRLADIADGEPEFKVVGQCANFISGTSARCFIATIDYHQYITNTEVL